MVPTEPKPQPKPQPIGNITTIVLPTLCIICVLFLLWRKADALRNVVSYQLKNWRHPEGRIRLSEDNGPAHTEFLDLHYDEDNERIDDDDEPLSDRVKQAVADMPVLGESMSVPHRSGSEDTIRNLA